MNIKDVAKVTAEKKITVKTSTSITYCLNFHLVKN